MRQSLSTKKTTVTESSTTFHKRVSRVGLNDGMSLTANQSLREKIENDIKNRPSVSKFAGSVKESPNASSRVEIEHKSRESIASASV